jgi:hypothetical protein
MANDYRKLGILMSSTSLTPDSNAMRLTTFVECNDGHTVFHVEEDDQPMTWRGIPYPQNVDELPIEDISTLLRLTNGLTIIPKAKVKDNANL